MQCDSLSAFGGIAALNRQVDLKVAEKLHKTGFLEVIAAPGYSDDALALLKKKKARRIIVFPGTDDRMNRLDVKWFCDGALIQQSDSVDESSIDFKTVVGENPDEKLLSDIDFAWRICAFVKSNAIVLAKDGATVGIGAGQVSRIDAAEIAVRKAGKRAYGSILASDAFIPFPDVVEVAAENDIAVIVQPGGSKGDDAVIDACRKKGITLLFTNCRHFKH